MVVLIFVLSFINMFFFQTVALIFLNTILDQCTKLSDRVRIQSEIEEAGFDIEFLEKVRFALHKEFKCTIYLFCIMNDLKKCGYIFLNYQEEESQKFSKYLSIS